jgi:hypothetical protein
MATKVSYVVSFERRVLAPGTSYTDRPDKSELFRGYVLAASYGILTDEACGLGYDDVSWFFDDLAEALAFARAMDNVVPGPTRWYREAYLDGVDTHHAQVAEYTQDEEGVLSEFVRTIPHGRSMGQPQ